ncbi:unnamed protein product, partial [Larinioides sclopetarius]
IETSPNRRGCRISQLFQNFKQKAIEKIFLEILDIHFEAVKNWKRQDNEPAWEQLVATRRSFVCAFSKVSPCGKGR